VPDEEQCVPVVIADFIHEHIDRLETMHVLLLLQATAPRAWTVRQVSVERQSSVYSAELSLRQLNRAGLIVRSDGLFSFQPHTSELAERVASLVSIYRARPISIISLIFSGPRGPS